MMSENDIIFFNHINKVILRFFKFIYIYLFKKTIIYEKLEFDDNMACFISIKTIDQLIIVNMP